MDMGAHDYWFAVEYYEDIWDEVPENYSVRTGQESTEQEPTEDDFGVMPYNDHNWQELATDEEAQERARTITVIEHRFLGTRCPYCQQDFANGQFVAKYRRGHAACLDCFDNAVQPRMASLHILPQEPHCTYCTRARARPRRGLGSLHQPRERRGRGRRGQY